MNIIEEYFKKKASRISFLEVRDDVLFEIKGYPSDKQIPLPIITEILIKEIEKGNMEEEIKFTHIMEGIIYLLGTDSTFPYIDDYKNILKTSNENIEEYIFYEGIKLIEKKDYDNGAIYFRALKSINNKNINGLFNYALTLEEIAKQHLEMDKEEEGLKFLQKSTNELESILDIDDKYPLAYYKLGYHYKFFGQFLKAKLIWTKHLTFDKDELRLQEIRTEIDFIEDDVKLESGLTYLSHEQYDNALDMFLKILPKYKEWWELNYFIGIAYKGLGDLEKAIDYLDTAKDLNNEEGDIYNELGICKFNLGDINGAIDIFTEGLKYIPQDHKLLFNRGLGYLQLNELSKSYADIDKAVSLNPQDENMIRQRDVLESLLKE